ncbi:MAG TPA: hypothetical protein VEN81_02640, partial [Planctomycetota bacterium]|nr:hypothetical protein [Planctomycetota bacterium]
MIALTCLWAIMAASGVPEAPGSFPRTLAEAETSPDEDPVPEVGEPEPPPPPPSLPASLLAWPLPSIASAGPGLQEPQPAREPETPHGSVGGFLHSHTSRVAWRDFVWRDYLTQPEVLLPLGLAAGAAVISHWDKPLENRAIGMWGERKDIADVTAGILIGGSIVLGGLFPGDGRNWWDELWNVGEAYGLSTVATAT